MVRDAEQLGLEVRIGLVRCGSVSTDHWMFEHDGERILNWWPGTGKWYDPGTGKKGRIRDVDEVMHMARDIKEWREANAMVIP